MRVAGLGYSDGVRNLEVMLESLSGGRRREIQEDGIVMYLPDSRLLPPLRDYSITSLAILYILCYLQRCPNLVFVPL